MTISTPEFLFRRNTLHIIQDFSTIHNVLHDLYPQCVLDGEIFSFLYVVCSASFDSLVEKLLLVRGEIYPSVSRPLAIVRDIVCYLRIEKLSEISELLSCYKYCRHL